MSTTCSRRLLSRSKRPPRVRAFLISALAAVLGAGPAGGARVEIVADAASAESVAAAILLQESLRPGEDSAVLEIGSDALSDPIAKGRLLARLSRADLLVPIGDSAAYFVSEELQNAPAYFIGAAVLDGSYLAGPGATGILALDPASIYRAASGLGLKKIGLLYTDGYHPVAARIAASAPAGVAMLPIRVVSRDQIVPSLNRLFGRVNAVWVLGDPLFTRGAGFQFLVEQTLARRVPVIAASPWEVRRGALLCSHVDAKTLIPAATAALKSALRQELKFPPPRIATARNGELLFNASLLKRWRLRPPREVRWRTAP